MLMFNSLKYLLACVGVVVSCVCYAQETDSLSRTTTDSLMSVVADTTRRDSVAQQKPEPVRPVRTLGKVAVIDTLPTANDALSIILFNDNTWRYILAEDYKNDPTVFDDHWNTEATHAYSDVDVNSLPEATAIRLVDSLESYHYPYLGRITSRYGPRRGRPHQGIDLSLKTGDPVYATFDGKVRVSKVAGNYGNLIVIRHNNGLETYYAHLSARDVEVGDWVVAGQQIGLGGSTGKSTGPHLHFEVRYRGQSFDPERIIDFATGDLRRDELLLKRRHFSIYAKFEQDFDDELEAEKQEEAERKAAAAIQYHTVRSGDTLGALARKYGTTVTKLCQLNGIKSTSILRIGQRLRVR
ncbi:MAG: peptidoglycan DD-metalloendopeptidase family protein [Alistipes sp.]|nr:peptidoglycan DD-metalloendopeptidase family protein [Alistipes sp.]